MTGRRGLSTSLSAPRGFITQSHTIIPGCPFRNPDTPDEYRGFTAIAKVQVGAFRLWRLIQPSSTPYSAHEGDNRLPSVCLVRVPTRVVYPCFPHFQRKYMAHVIHYTVPVPVFIISPPVFLRLILTASHAYALFTASRA